MAEVADPQFLTRNQRYYQRLGEQRRQLIMEMGGVCNYCGETDISKLEFNHLKERRWSARKTSSVMRLQLYREEWINEELDLACGDCNKRLGRPGEPTEPDPDFYVEDDF